MGEIANADGVGQVGNPKCGDIMKMYLKIDGDVITDVKFKTFGCGSAIATSSMATEMIKGKTIAEAMTLTNAAVAEALDGLPAYKMHCSVLAEEAIKAALADYYRRQGRECPKPSACPVRRRGTAAAPAATEPGHARPRNRSGSGAFFLTEGGACHKIGRNFVRNKGVWSVIELKHISKTFPTADGVFQAWTTSI